MPRPTRKTKNVDYIKFEKKLDKRIKNTKHIGDGKKRTKKLLDVYKRFGA